MSKPDPAVARRIYNTGESNFLKGIQKSMLPKIRLQKKFYVPMLLPCLTIDSLDQIHRAFLAGECKGLVANDQPSNANTSVKSDSQLNDSTSSLYWTRKEDWIPSERVKIRLLSPMDFPVDWKTGRRLRYGEVQPGGASCFSCCRKPTLSVKPVVREVPGIIVQLHGGGFIAMSSAQSRNHTIEYSNRTGMPLFSVDYRLAPADPFPAAVNDCW